MKRTAIIACLLLFACCTGIPVPVSRVERGGERPYLEVDGKPFAMFGAQIRTDIFRNCDYMSWSGMEAYFDKAVELGVNTVELPHTWRFLEPEKDRYCFEAIDTLLEMAVSHGLKVDLLWFGSNMIGDTYSFFVPPYILREERLHMLRDDEGRATNLYGYDHILYLDDPWLVEREATAIRTLFDHIADWDARHGRRHPVICCQIENEPDGGVRWRMDQQRFRHRDSTLVTKEEMWKMTLGSLDAVGRAVQQSRYRVATRTNIIFGNNVNPFPQAPEARAADVYALEGIDFASVDPYKETIDELVDNVAGYASLPGNIALVAENRGAFRNTPSLMLAAAAVGGGYCIYDLATSRYITAHSRPPFESEGVYDSLLGEKPHTGAVRDMLKGLVEASEDVAQTSLENFAAFNIVSDSPEKEISQTISTTGAEITFTTVDGALGFALDRGSRIVLYSTAPAVFILGNGSAGGGNEIHTEGKELKDIPFTSSGKKESTTSLFIGTYYTAKKNAD